MYVYKEAAYCFQCFSWKLSTASGVSKERQLWGDGMAILGHVCQHLGQVCDV
jgi:hypothetical protein